MQCGDGVLDPGEECDCGEEERCVQSRAQCVPRGLRRGEAQCTSRRGGHKVGVPY